MSHRRYCLDCGEAWKDDADAHQMKCAARALLLARRVADARAFIGSMSDAPEPKFRPNRSPRQVWFCTSCGVHWSGFAGAHGRECSARWLIARGDRWKARKLYRKLRERTGIANLEARFGKVAG